MGTNVSLSNSSSIMCKLNASFGNTETLECNCYMQIMLCNADISTHIMRCYYNCVSTVLAVFRFCIHVVLLLWMVEVLRSLQTICEPPWQVFTLGKASSEGIVLHGRTMTSSMPAVEPLWYPIRECRSKKPFMGICV
jgi:hypothetical protein